MRATHRSTQRAPLSCTSCAARKVKCSRTIPCQACLSRGNAADCKREVVVVRGRARNADTPGSSPSNADLLLENARLSELLSRSRAQESSNVTTLELTEYYEKRLYLAVGQAHRPRTVASILEAALPTQDCSHIFVKFADIWTSWVHFGYFPPDFRKEHEQFWIQGGDMTATEPLWLALYFAVLACALVFMSDEDFAQSRAPIHSRVQLTRTWFDAALFFMDQGDFIQKSHIRVVQTIVVLGNVASTVGETQRHATLWAVAIRIAQQLQLGCDEMHFSESVVQQEARRRLWWTLVICEWIPIPHRSPCVSDLEFNCQLPMDVSDTKLLKIDTGDARAAAENICPVQYHIVMAKVARVYHHLHAKLRLRKWSPTGVANFVIQADDQLADIIEQIPRHLQHDNNLPSEDLQELERRLPWIATQRKSLVIVLLYYRMAINRILQIYWLEGSTNFARARSICLSSAAGVIGSATSGEMTFSRLRSWDFAMVLFSTTATLVLEVRRTPNIDSEYTSAIVRGLDILERVESQNELAKEALCILNNLRLG